MAVPGSELAEPQRTALVVLFAETRGFTRTSEMLEPAIVFSRVSEFFELIAAVVETREGVVRNLINDTLMATFAGPDDVQHAVQAAQDIQRDFTVLEETWKRDYGIRVAVALGLHKGDAVTGDSGGRIPGLSLVIGDTVSVAERLLHRARAGEFVMSKIVMDSFLAAGFVLDDAEELPPLNLPRREPLPIFGVLRDGGLDFT